MHGLRACEVVAASPAVVGHETPSLFTWSPYANKHGALRPKIPRKLRT